MIFRFNYGSIWYSDGLRRLDNLRSHRISHRSSDDADCVEIFRFQCGYRTGMGGTGWVILAYKKARFVANAESIRLYTISQKMAEAVCEMIVKNVLPSSRDKFEIIWPIYRQILRIVHDAAGQEKYIILRRITQRNAVTHHSARIVSPKQGNGATEQDY